MNVNNIATGSMVNGDGTRLVIAFQGCSLNCKGCFSPELQQFDEGMELTPEELVCIVENEFGKDDFLNGLTLSGGNPTEQFELVDFLKILRKRLPNINIWMWSGHTWDELNDFETRHCPLPYIDTIISGRFIISKKVEHHYYGSSNQEVWRKENNIWSKDR